MDNSALDQLTRYWNRLWNVCQVRWHRPNAQWRRPPGRPHNSWLQQINNGSLRGIRQSWRAAEDRGHRGSSLRAAAAYALRWWWWICSIYALVTMQEWLRHSRSQHRCRICVPTARRTACTPGSGVNASSRLVGSSLVSRLSACLTEADWWRLIAEWNRLESERTEGNQYWSAISESTW